MGALKTSALVIITAVAIASIPKLFQTKLAKTGRGYSAPGPWKKVADVFRYYTPVPGLST